ncbi:MAG: toll/interleukin-1 receptor domain-containing protein [Agriterribacter sp.]
MKNVFISYRRSDSQDITDRIYDYLVQAFGKDVIFKDVDNIDLGENFKNRIFSTIKNSSALIVIIGKDWLNAVDEKGYPRLNHNDDYVRIEIETAIANGIPVLPILVKNGTMPDRNFLPLSLQSICDINALNIRPDPDFRGDMNKLIARVAFLTGNRIKDNGKQKNILKVRVLISCIIFFALSGGIYFFSGGNFFEFGNDKNQGFNFKIRLLKNDTSAGLLNEGKVMLYTGNETKTADIQEGEVLFYNIPSRYNNKKVKISATIKDYTLDNPGEILLSKKEEPVDIKISRLSQPAFCEIRGSIINEKGNPVENAFIDFDSGLITGYTNQKGNFNLKIPLPSGTRVRLRILINNIVRFNENVTLSSDTPMNLKIGSKS